jgi:hypothetical protein
VNAETVSKVKELVCADQQITINEAVNEVGISYGSAQTIMTEQQMRWDQTRWILHNNNATSYTAMVMQQFSIEKQIMLML